MEGAGPAISYLLFILLFPFSFCFAPVVLPVDDNFFFLTAELALHTQRYLHT